MSVAAFQTAISNCASAVGSGNWTDARKYLAQARVYLIEIPSETQTEVMRTAFNGQHNSISALAMWIEKNYTQSQVTSNGLFGEFKAKYVADDQGDC